MRVKIWGNTDPTNGNKMSDFFSKNLTWHCKWGSDEFSDRKQYYSTIVVKINHWYMYRDCLKSWFA